MTDGERYDLMIDEIYELKKENKNLKKEVEKERLCRMTRLDLLKKELEIVTELRCLSFYVKDLAKNNYEGEIEAIEKFHAENPEVNDNVRVG